VLGAVNEAAAAQQVTWAGDLTLLWPPEPVFVGLSKVTVRRMVANLLANATRAAGSAGRVTIQVSRRTAQMLLAVEDDGPGFGRIRKGFGLGLSAVAREAIEHGGRLECGRGSLGGARVSLWLPTVVSGMGGMRGRTADAARAV
jgi:signal transduction histidine kinase